MAAMAFFFIMLVLFFITLFFITLNVIFIIIWSVRKCKGKAPKKRYIVIPIIFLIISFLVESIPIGWVLLLRTGNSSASKDIVMAKSGKIVYWSSDENGAPTGVSFEMDGTGYIRLDCSVSTDTWKLGKPVANIRYKSDEEALNKFMKFLFAGDFTSTLYPVINGNGFELYTIGNDIYCPENQKDLVLAYYGDLSNYDTQNCKYEYALYPEEKETDGNTGLKSIDKNVTLNKGIFEELYQIANKQKAEIIKIPEKYNHIYNEKKPGTPINGYDDIMLYSYSKDRVMSKDVELALIDGQIYCLKESDNESITGYRLPYELNKYLKNMIFQGI